MTPVRLLKVLLIGLLASLLAGCLPIPVITIDSTTIEAGTPFTVDGSSSVASNVPEGTVIASYSWNFGDGSRDSGAQVEHVYEAAGSYVITLTVIDSAGRVASAEEPVTVKPASTTSSTGDGTTTTMPL